MLLLSRGTWIILCDFQERVLTQRGWCGHDEGGKVMWYGHRLLGQDKAIAPGIVSFSYLFLLGITKRLRSISSC